MDDRILDLLGSGLSPSVTASVLGCSESRISQLLSDENFATQVTAKRLASMQGTIARDQNWDSLEDALLAKLHNLLAFIQDPMKIVRILQVANTAKRRGAPALEHTSLAPKTVVPLMLPTHMTINFIRNGQNEVVEVNGRSLISATQQQVLTLKDANTVNEGNNDGSGRVPALLERSGTET